ncbi:auxin response factor 1-like [Rutidosis leptorrhynchoides]|uniref:auxin response factor 1-like n=1 Tax=Rutidosis leptorrhynchoides TaxID=125765 RepID=UPI003A990D1F
MVWWCFGGALVVRQMVVRLSGGGGVGGGTQYDDVHNKLWHLCAGPLGTVPVIGERTYYFPEGHLEQIGAFMPHEKTLPYIYSPDKILCKVLHVLLQADLETGEVYARITLLPVNDQSEVTIPDPEVQEPSSCSVHSMCKILTESDLSKQHELSLPCRQTIDFLPPLLSGTYYKSHGQDKSQKPPLQELVARDIHGNQWRFCHTLKGQPKRHYLTGGWSEFVKAKKLVPGDAVIFLRGENGGLHVGIRKRMRVSGYMPGQSQLGILTVASHAIATGTRFTVDYKPRACHFPFVISMNKYLESRNYRLSVGLKFKIKCEGEHVREKRYLL